MPFWVLVQYCDFLDLNTIPIIAIPIIDIVRLVLLAHNS